MQNAENPFWYGDTVAPLVAREADVAALVDALCSAGRVVLAGPRHIGKSAVLATACDNATTLGVAVLAYDAEAHESVESLAREIASGATRTFATSLDHAGDIARRFFAPIRASASYDFTTQRLTIGVSPTPAQRRRPITILTAVLDGIEQLAATHGRPTAVVLDEFHEILTEGGDDSAQELRSAIGSHRFTGYVFATSRLRLLDTAPLAHLGRLHLLSPIPRSDFGPFIRHGLASTSAQIDDAAIDRILDAADDVPLNVQWLASRCWDDLQLSPDPALLTAASVDAALDRIVGEHYPHYMLMWASLTSAQRRTLKAVALEPSTDFRITEVAGSAGLAPSTMQRTLAALEERGLIHYATSQSGTGRASYWRLSDPFFTHWLARAQASV